jgi:hypothetical protein
MTGAGGVNQDESQANAPDPSGTAGGLVDIFLAPELEDSRWGPFEELRFAERQIQPRMCKTMTMEGHTSRCIHIHRVRRSVPSTFC